MVHHGHASENATQGCDTAHGQVYTGGQYDRKLAHGHDSHHRRTLGNTLQVARGAEYRGRQGQHDTQCGENKEGRMFGYEITHARNIPQLKAAEDRFVQIIL